MSRQRFTPVTSNLLVRKGEAKPWRAKASDLDQYSDFAPRPQNLPEAPDGDYRHSPDYRRWEPAPETKVGVESKHHEHSDHVVSDDHGKRCSIRLSHEEYERIGIVAVKRNISRQQVLRQAIDNYLDDARREFQSTCGCLGNCRGDC